MKHLHSSLFIGFILLSSWTSCINGQYGTPFLIAIEPNPPGVEVDPVTGTIRINEENPTNIRVAEIIYTGDPGPQFGGVVGGPSGAPAPRFLVKEVDEKYFLEIQSIFDYEQIASSPLYAVRLVPALPSNLFIQIQVVDINDNYPVIDCVGGAEFWIPENAHNESIHQYSATDADAIDDGKLVFGLRDLDDPANTSFIINPTTGVFAMKPGVELDFEKRVSHRVIISVTDSPPESNEAPCAVTMITVQDMPDEPPRWVEITSSITIDEAEPIEDYKKFPYEAIDQDREVNSPIIYSTEKIPVNPVGQPYLKINEASGLLSVVAEIDADVMTSTVFQFSVIATEEQDPYKWITLPVFFTVNDVNNKRPRFDDDEIERTFQVTIPEGYDVTAELPLTDTQSNFLISDDDFSLQFNSYIAFMEVSGSAFVTEALRVAPTAGSGKNSAFSVLIYNRTKIDFEDPLWREEIQFTVRISETDDQVQHDALAKVILKIQNINDNDPIFDEELECMQAGECVVLVPEDTKKDVEILETFNAKDADFDDLNDFGTLSLRYEWYKRVPAHLKLNSETGAVTVKTDSAFDYERLEEEIYIIQVCDMFCLDGSRSTTITLKLVIEDVNDEIPTIYVPPIIPILENSSKIDIFNGVLMRINDVDTTADLEIVLDLEPEIQGWFVLEYSMLNDTIETGASYSIRIWAEDSIVDRELYDRVDFRVIARDRNTSLDHLEKESATATLTVQIRDVNDNPPKFEDFNGLANFRESDFEEGEDDTAISDDEREIMSFRASDLDLSTTLTFNFTSPYERMLDFVELVPVPNNQFRAILRRLLDQPIDREESDVIPEMPDTSYLIYTIIVSDGEHETSADVNITVVDINDNSPEFKNEDNFFEVSEGVWNNTFIETFEATDKDTGAFGTVRYFLDEIYSEGNGIDKFHIDMITGELTVVATLDRETQDTYRLQINAVDYYRPSSSAGSNTVPYRIEILLLDVNDNNPKFDPDSKMDDKNENEINPGDVLGAINVTDADLGENKRMSFEILNVTCDNGKVEDPKSLFTFVPVIVPGDVYPSGLNILAEDGANFIGKYGQYSLTIKAKDHGIPELSANGTFGFKVIDVNLNSPVFEFPPENHTVYISRGSTVGAPLEDWTGLKIPAVNATDEDDPATGNGLIVYSLIPTGEVDDDSTDFFRMASESRGEILVSQSLLLRDSPLFKLQIRIADSPATPGTPLERFRNLTIILVPTINYPPEFSIEDDSVIVAFDFEENNPNLNLTLLPATDQDILNGSNGVINPFNERICYYIIDGDKDFGDFILNVETNILTLKDELDREKVARYDLRILAKNFPLPDCPVEVGSTDAIDKSILIVIITVLDVNDEAPVFVTNPNDIISGGIKILASIRSLNITVEANDLDENDVVEYRISSGVVGSNPSLPSKPINEVGEVFSLDSASGLLQNTFQPQASMSGYYEFTISATDTAEPPHETFVQCKIHLITENHAVIFKFNNAADFFTLPKREELADIMSRVFEYSCNIERAIDTVNEAGIPIIGVGRTTVHSHFINVLKDEPVDSVVITSEQFNEGTMHNLTTLLAVAGFSLSQFGEDQDTSNPVSADKIMIYVLASGIAVLVVTLTVLGVTCWYNNRSLSRRVRALTASTFGSQQSGLNRAGATNKQLPTTNQFAIQGSNPIWSTKGNDKGYGDYDAESIASGGSVLIGAEDEDYFNDKNPGEKNNNYNYNSDGGSSNPIIGDDNNSNYEYIPDQPRRPMDNLPNPIGTVTRRNPLMNFNMEGKDGEASDS